VARATPAGKGPRWRAALRLVRRALRPLRRGRWRWPLRLLGAALLLVAVGKVLPRVWPKQPLSLGYASSIAVTSERGELLRLTLTPDQQYRLWTPLAKIWSCSVPVGGVIVKR